VFVAAVVILAALVVVVLALGGLGERKTTSVTVAPGDEIDTGMMVFVLSSATASHSASSGYWSVVVTGTVRNPNSESLAPVEPMYGSVTGVDEATSQFVATPAYCLGPCAADEFRISERVLLPPRSEWTDIRMRFTLDDPYEPSDTFPVLLRPMVYETAAVLGYSSAESWVAQSGARTFVVRVPLTRVIPFSEPIVSYR